jgi:hypothetical protein
VPAKTPLPSKSCCPTCGKPSILYGLKAKAKSEGDSYRLRIRDLISRFELEPYTTYERDLSVACAVTQLMAAAQGDKSHLERILAMHMERIIASQMVQDEAESLGVGQ